MMPSLQAVARLPTCSGGSINWLPLETFLLAQHLQLGHQPRYTRQQQKVHGENEPDHSAPGPARWRLFWPSYDRISAAWSWER